MQEAAFRSCLETDTALGVEVMEGEVEFTLI
jgi:hypothetical protein